MQWCMVDLHNHTPASGDYQQPDVKFIDLLLRAEARNIAIIAVTDHNTVAGYKRMQVEIQQLELLEKLKRLLPEEETSLREYRRLLQKILVLPGFEFTATFGFHILAIFSPEKPVREIEHLLIDLRIPTDQLDIGSATIGASTDVLSAYQMIAEAGGLVIAAHANSTNGVAMRGFPIGGQTKIAYTQDKNLHALEVTDLDQRGSRSTAAFFNGTKPEYPRRMHCIQGSDSHRLMLDPLHKKNLGFGDRATDVLLPDLSFEALYELFTSHDFARTRPHRHKEEPVYDFIRTAREEGANIVQAFHESMTVRAGKRYAVLADICAFSNTNGGTLYIGISDNPQKPVVGILDAEQAMVSLEKEISDRISPLLQCTLDIHDVSGKKIMRVLVPRGDEPPYAVDQNKIYVRSETETGMAVRDEIVELVKRSFLSVTPIGDTLALPAKETLDLTGHNMVEEDREAPPRTGVEVVAVDYLTDLPAYTMRDLRNGNVVKNVTQKSARRLWHYAITTHANLPEDVSKAKIDWQGNFGLIRRYKQEKKERYDLVQRTGSGYRFYFGVTEDGIHGQWKKLVGQEED